jgi:hypothetical protein
LYNSSIFLESMKRPTFLCQVKKTRFIIIKCCKAHQLFFVAENSNKLQKIGFGRKNQLNPPSMCSHWANGTGYTSKNENIKIYKRFT